MMVDKESLLKKLTTFALSVRTTLDNRAQAQAAIGEELEEAKNIPEQRAKLLEQREALEKQAKAERDPARQKALDNAIAANNQTLGLFAQTEAKLGDFQEQLKAHDTVLGIYSQRLNEVVHEAQLNPTLIEPKTIKEIMDGVDIKLGEQGVYARNPEKTGGDDDNFLANFAKKHNIELSPR